jgi:hypothetical protein
VPELLQRRDALISIDQHLSAGTSRLLDHHDGALLAMLGS